MSVNLPKMSKVLTPLLALFLLTVSSSLGFGQATGSIQGSVMDASKARIPGVTVRVVNSQTGAARTAVTKTTGDYEFSALPPGNYEISAEMAGFQKVIQRATLSGGQNLAVDLTLQPGAAGQVVRGGSEPSTTSRPQTQEAAKVGTDIPVQGRNVFEFAKQAAGVTVTAGASAGRGSEVTVSIGGQNKPRVTIDGVTVTDIFSGANAVLSISPEAVQEMQVLANSGDPSQGLGQAGGVNIVTRGGGKDFRGVYTNYFRDNKFAAFPGLIHNPPKPNPTNDPKIAEFNEAQEHPPFRRYQFGAVFSGPIKKNKVFFLAGWEDSPSRSADILDTNTPELAAFNEIQSVDAGRRWWNGRVDWRVNPKNSLFWRVTRDRPFGRLRPLGNTLSNRTFQKVRTQAYMMAWTSTLSPSMVNDLRIGFDRHQLTEGVPPVAKDEANLYYTDAAGVAGKSGLPWSGMTQILGRNLTIGNHATGPNTGLEPRQALTEALSWTKGRHALKFGGDYERAPWYIWWSTQTPFFATLFNATQAAAAGIAVPAKFNTLADLIQLPVNTFSFGIGRANIIHDTFQEKNIHVEHQYHVYAGDTYRATNNLTLTYSLGWGYVENMLNWDLPKPPILSKVLNGNLKANTNYKNMYLPAFGFAWAPRGNARTIIRGGTGIFHGVISGFTAIKPERSLIAPLGTGYMTVPGGSIGNFRSLGITNPLTGINDGNLNFTTAAANKTAGIVRLADLIPYLGALRSEVLTKVFTNTNTDLNNTNLDFFKSTSDPAQGTGASSLIDPDFRPPLSVANNAAFQQSIGKDYTVSVTGMYNVTTHLPMKSDLNNFERPKGLGGPVDPRLGYVFVNQSSGRAAYRGALFSLTKRLSNRWTMNSSYTLSRFRLTVAQLIDQNDGFRGNNFSYDAGNPTHLWISSGTVNLPWDISLTFVNTVVGRTPIKVFLSLVDLDGDGTTSDILPGVPLNALNRSVDEEGLRAAVADFNATFAGKKDARGITINKISDAVVNRISSEDFSFGKRTINQDFRLAKAFKFKEKLTVSIRAEMYNMLNIGNKQWVGSAGNLYSGGFGLPGQRVGNVFGSGGPRSFQFGARVSF